MMTLDDRRLADPEFNLEIGTDTPNIRLMIRELEDVQSTMSYYKDRNYNAYQAWHARWPNQCIDGRKHSDPNNPEDEAFPWERASDTRVRTVKQTINDHVTLARFAYKQAKVDAQPVRPFGEGRAREATQGGMLLKWQKATQLRNDFQREIPLALNWCFGYGAAFIAPTWWQCRRLEYKELTIPILAEIVAAQTGAQPLQALMEVQSALGDPAQFDRLVTFIQSLSPIVTAGQARTALRSLQQLGYVTLFKTPADGPDGLPVPYTFRSQPRLMALRPGIDVLFRDLTGDIQAEPWVAWGEWVSETDLMDRVATENYDPKFVREAIRQQGQGSDDIWDQQTLAERGAYGGAGWVNAQAHAKMSPLFHFLYKAHYKGVPALYWTIFNPAVAGRDLKNPVIARHTLHPYKHGLYPLVAMRREREDRPILSSQGICELAYTYQQEEKTQVDGLADRTSLAHRPPLVGPITRQNAITGTPMPGSYIGVTRPGEFSWMPLPQPDPTPVQVLRIVAARIERLFPIFGADLDPDLKNMKRAEVAGDRIEELVEVFEHIFYLDQQYMPDSDVADLVGELKMPFQTDRTKIQGRHNVMIVFDAQMVNADYVDRKIEMLGKAMPFNQGAANMNQFFRAMLELADPDIADQVIESDAVATDRERSDEKQAFLQMLNGMEPDKPQYANHQLRLQVIQEQLATPGMAQKVQSNEVTAALVKNRVAWHIAQIQQYQQNPQIGRTLTTKTFTKQAPELTAPEVGS